MQKQRHIIWRLIRSTFLGMLATTVAVGIVCVMRTVPPVALSALKNADTFELLSLDPDRTSGGFHRHAVLGTTMIRDSAVRQRLIAALRSGARWNIPLEVLCFDPRHGIRVTHAGQITDLLICFECEQVEVWQDDRRLAIFKTGSGPQSAFDRVLKDAGVTLQATTDVGVGAH